MTYAQALKAYAQKHGKFILPKKGSSEYAEVRSMMEAELGRDTPEQVARQNRASEIAKKPNATSEGNLVVSDASELKTTKGASTKNKKRIEPPPMKTKMIDDPADELKGKKVVKNAEEPEKKVKGKGVNRTGKSTAICNTEMLVNSNTGMSAEVSAQKPDQKEKIKKDLKKKVETTIEVEKATDKTIQNMKTDDTEALDGGNIPFSITALRKKLLC